MAKRKVYRKDVMGQNNPIKYIIVPCAIVVLASFIFLLWWTNNQNSTKKNIEYIRSFMSSSGQLRDYSNKLGMHDPEEDIKWYKTKDEIRIEFGRIFLTWEPEEFYDEENLKSLETIGFTIKIKVSKNGEKVLHLYYMGNEVERWIK